MRLTRITVIAATALVAGLGLTACNSDGGSTGARGGASSTASTTTGGGSAAPGSTTGGSGGTSATTAGSTTGGTATGGTTGGGSGKGAGSATGTRCTTADLTVKVVGPESDASEQEPAMAAVQAVNKSGRTCTLKGFPGVRLVDDQAKSGPMTARRQEGSPSAVTLAPGGKAVARLAYGNINGQGTAGARKVCGMQASYANVILPDETASLKVKVSGGVDNGTLNVCGSELVVNAFEPLDH